MKSWNGFLLLAIALGLLATAACTRGVSQTEYDKAKADLATAQGQAKELDTQLGSVKASLDKTNADLAQAKADSDKAKTDLATAQGQAKESVESTAIGRFKPLPVAAASWSIWSASRGMSGELWV